MTKLASKPPLPTKPFVGIDLGGTNMQIGVVSPQLKILGQAKRKTKASEGFEAVLQRISEGILEACQLAGIMPSDLGGIGIGAPGVIDPATGIVHEAPNMRWNDAPLGDALSKKLRLPVTVDNDVNVAIYGENALGAGKQSSHVMGIWIGTGIGAGLVLDGKLFYGHFFSAGEIGQTILFPFHPLGGRTLEDNASRTNITNRIIKLINANHKSKLTEELGPDPDSWSKDVKSKAIAKHYRGGEREDELVVQVVDAAAEMVAISVANAVTLLSLERVVLGGGLTEACGKAFVERVQRHVKSFVFPKQCQRVDIVASKLEDTAGIYGAALLAMEKTP
jgi:glucokinase